MKCKGKVVFSRPAKRFFMLLCVVFLSNPYAKGDAYKNNELKSYEWMEKKDKETSDWLQYRTFKSRREIKNTAHKKQIDIEINKINRIEGNYIYDIKEIGNNRFYLRGDNQHPYARLFLKHRDVERLLIDPPMGITFFSPSHDGKYIAYGLCKSGSEIASIHVLDVKSGRNLTDYIPGARYPHVVWLPDNHSFFYSRLPAARHNVPSFKKLADKKVYIHKLGDGYKKDAVILHSGMFSGDGANIYSNISVYLSPNSNWLLASVSSSISGYSSSLYITPLNSINGAKTTWRKIFDKENKVSNFVIFKNYLFIAKYNNASGYSITKISLDQKNAKEQAVISWSNGELLEFSTSSDALYVAYRTSGKRKFVRVDIDNTDHVYDIPVPFDGEITALFPSSDKKNIMFTLQDWINPPAIYSYTPGDKVAVNTNLTSSSRYDTRNYEAKEVEVMSKDGVKVPLTLIMRKGSKLNGSSRTWLTAYGAYGVSTFPNFDPYRLIWLERGGIIAIAHVRGGGELGPDWHESGRLFKKENSVYDFLACADYLIKSGYTNNKKLVASGASAGGIVIGRAITLRPDMFSAVAIDVGILNTVKLDRIPIGPMNFKEFGSPEIAKEKENLYQLDAFEHLHKGVHYPAVLLTVGLKDSRVSPWQSAKFAARLDEISQKVEKPNALLVIADKDAGHNDSNLKQHGEKMSDIISFFLSQTDGQ